MGPGSLLKRITVILPIAYRGGSLRVAKTIARMIKKGSAEADDNCGVRLAVIQGKYDLQSDFRDLHEDEIEVREFEWERIEQQKAENIAFIQGQRADLYAAEYQIPVGGYDRLELPLAPVKPFVVFATDYIQRYVPEIFPRDGWGTVGHALSNSGSHGKGSSCYDASDPHGCNLLCGGSCIQSTSRADGF